MSAPDGFAERFNVSRESMERLELYAKLTSSWQQHINLIAPSTLPDLWERHIADSLQLLALIPSDTQVIADLGSGGGFPGMVLACTSSATVHMYEANQKKVSFLQEVLRQTKANGVVHRMRLEDLYDVKLPRATIVTARALAPLNELLGLALPFLGNGAVGLFHKGRESDAEIALAAQSFEISYTKHESQIDSQSTVLEVKEVRLVKT